MATLRFYLILLFSVIGFSNQLFSQFSQVSSTTYKCVDQFDLQNDIINGETMGAGDTCRVLITISDVSAIEFTNFSLNLNFSDTLIIFDGTDISDTLFIATKATSSPSSSLYSSGSSVIIQFYNNKTIDTDVTIDWRGIIDYTATVDGVKCKGDATGGVDIVSDYSPSSVKWYRNGSLLSEESSFTIINQPVGEYIVLADNTDECYLKDTFIINEPSTSVSAVFVDSSDINGNGYGISCSDATDGWLQVTATGGTSPYTYLWSANADIDGVSQTSVKAVNLEAGVYSVTVTDDNGCSNVLSGLHLTEPLLLDVNLDKQVNCSYNGGSDGLLEITAVKGITPYNFNWIGDVSSASNEDQYDLSSGFYTVKVTDANSCNTEKTFEITEPDKLLGGEIEIGGANSTYVCNGDTVFYFVQKISSSGGKTPNNYTFSWEYSKDNTTWITIVSGLVDSSYIWTYKVEQDMYIRRVVSDGVVSALSNTVFLDFIEPPSLVLQNIDTSYCENGVSSQIKGVPYYAGSFFVSDASLTDNGDGTADIYPSLTVSSTSEYFIKYNYLDQYGCKDSIVDSFYIRPVTKPGFYLNTTYTTDDDAVKIKNIFPQGGVFSGSGVVASDSMFYPSGLEPENSYDIKYVYTNEYGCTTDSVRSVHIVSGTGNIVIAGEGTMQTKFCIDGDAVTIEALPAFDNSTSGVFTSNATDHGDKQYATFDPSSFSEPGDYVIEYSYEGTDGSFVIQQQVTIYDVTNEAVIYDLDTVYCNYGQKIPIKANPLINGDVGEFSGYGVINNTDRATFDVNEASVYSNPIEVKYLYTHYESGCRDSALVYVTVNEKPTVSFEIKDLFNKEEAKRKFKNIIPYGGEFEGRGVIKEDSVFDPQLADLGNNLISYSFTNQYGCKDTMQRVVVVEEATGDFNNIEEYYCYDDTVSEIEVTGITNPSGVIGVFKGYGITNIGENKAKFSPQVAYDSLSSTVSDSMAVVDIVFEYKGSDDSTVFTLKTSAKVRNNGVVTIFNLSDDRSYCSNDAAVDLTAQPANGIFSGDGMTDNIFNPGSISDDTTIITYIYTDDIAGCTVAESETIAVNNVPDLSLLFDDKICSNIPSDTIIGLPHGGIISTYLPFVRIDGRDDSIKYSPLPDFIGDNEITYTYTDTSNKCSNSITRILHIDTVPNVAIISNMPATGYCIADEDKLVLGWVNSQTAVSGIFAGEGIVDETQNNGKAFFNPQLAGVGQHHVLFSYTDVTGCSNTADSLFVVNPVPEVSMSGINQDKAYCGNDNEIVLLQGFPTTGYSSFRIDNRTFSTSTVSFVPSEYAAKDSIFISYFNSDANSCSNSVSEWVQIKEVPDVSFKMSNVCIADSIHFTYIGKTEKDSINSFLWKFGDGSTNNKNLNPAHYYKEAGVVKISLRMSLSNGCSNDTITPQVMLEDTPDPGFVWENECYGETVKFISESQESEYYNYQWDFGDNTISDDFQPEHIYDKEGKYIIVRAINSKNSSCRSLAIDTIYVRPVYNVTKDNSYSESFEQGHGFWIPRKLDSVYYSWQTGIPDGDVINTASDGENVYITNLTGTYYSNENSEVTSPCFVLSELDRPMISMDIYKQLDNRDGVVLQYTLDGGDTWENVGATDQGINWFNSENITSRPGGNTNDVGWTDTVSGWLDSRHNLDFMLDPKTNMVSDTVRFRFAFASDMYEQYEGFAFDNIRIGNRKRTVLIEHFTTTETSLAYSSDDIVNGITDSLYKDVIEIQYHTSFYSEDPFYSSYPKGSTTRESYYNLKSVPYSVLDGISEFDYSNSTPSEADVESRVLVEPVFNMGVSSERQGERINIDLKVQSKQTIKNRQMQLFIAVVEKSVSIESSEGTKVYHNVLRKFIPGTGGQYISSSWDRGELNEYNYSYTIDDYIDNPDSLLIISFIQDESTREILQVTTSESGEFVTSARRNHEGSKMILIYPNPAQIAVTFVLKEPIDRGEIQIVDRMGRLVSSISLNRSIQYTEYNVSKLNNGLYFVKVIKGTQVVSVQKLVVIH